MNPQDSKSIAINTEHHEMMRNVLTTYVLRDFTGRFRYDYVSKSCNV